MAGKYILEATGIMKSFSGVTVLNGAELCIEPGEQIGRASCRERV